MGNVNIQSCADAGSKYCPCHLAYSGDCIKCSLLRGKKTCDCVWQGVCIYSEVQHNKNLSICERQEHLCKIAQVKKIEEDLFFIKIQVPKNIVGELKSPGAYVLLKSKDKNSDIFNAPISVMDVNTQESYIEVVIKSMGIKTKSIINFDEVWVKGPYYNGVFGTRGLNNTNQENCLVILNGLSQVSAINIIKKLLENKNKVEVIFNSQSIILEEVKNKIQQMGINISIVNVFEDKNFISDYLSRNNVKFVYSGGCNNFNKIIMNIVDEVSEDIKLSISNNNLICCGEGICGACTVRINGEKMKSCKSQIDSREFLKTLK
ncbi:sulfide/dihydroorotate dehydrogenase-like FAD/NAD-binding protein [Romboutsia maritimum]|uniref:Sulfide/dihydroorotate dehydrogenase-like FAD/NAD-binding protein n=1 Tax=Romboutsia maritimum TaxID=2020948 RepID=A0A371IW95_9FIRM|nr:sulfide/dihydroorotate dehydrogenase-like FAD/NAD-binding protein [Romboutsia maritimum]RDY24761.1 sulfide/dihydroorotate dehydrogenase-like FAD/NAD-binding protein [Romboutsia maritimum]